MDLCCLAGICLDVGDGWCGGWLDTGWRDGSGFLGVVVSVVIDLYPNTWLVRRPQLVVMLVGYIALLLVYLIESSTPWDEVEDSIRAHR